MNTSPRSQSGFSLLEVLIGASILAIAVLGHSASIFSEQQLSREERARSTAMLATEQFMERLRSDDDFAGLFARLNTFQELSRRSSDADRASTAATGRRSTTEPNASSGSRSVSSAVRRPPSPSCFPRSSTAGATRSSTCDAPARPARS